MAHHHSSGRRKSIFKKKKDKKENVGEGKIVLVGNPNVGKSVIFNALTRAYVTVSNYPGTTVEVGRGKCRTDGLNSEVVDTPGMYSLLSITGEEKVTRALLFEEKPDTVVHVVDAKNLERMLSLTMQFTEAGLPVVLDVNIVDEAERLGLKIDINGLEEYLGIPVVATAGISGRGIKDLQKKIKDKKEYSSKLFSYDSFIETALVDITKILKTNYVLSKRAVSLLLLQDDPEIHQMVQERENDEYGQIQQIIKLLKKHYSHALNYIISLKRNEEVSRIAARFITPPENESTGFRETLSRIMINPLTGIPVLMAVLYFGLYLFVGVFGAGILVDLIEVNIFEGLINPFFIRLFERILPWPVVRDLFTGDYGILTLGLRYGIAIILPIVGTFFIVFSIIEDSGYFPRLALLVDRIFKKIGLSGRAVIPMILGFGCGTMATMVTRTLETRRERLIATFLLALAIPCSAQLGVILAILSENFAALLIWIFVITAVFLLVGLLTTRIMPGKQPDFYMELPPLRLPKISNVLVKTLSRMQWYFLEVIPFFLLASVVIWIGNIIGVFQLLVRVLGPVMRLLGLPKEAAVVFIFGFFRRDYGVAGLFDLRQAGILSFEQLLVAAVTLTLFIPCVAQFAVMLKERGWKATLGVTTFVFPFAFFIGFVVHMVFTLLGFSL